MEDYPGSDNHLYGLHTNTQGRWKKEKFDKKRIKEIKLFLKKAVPGIGFEYEDALGGKHDPNYLHCQIPHNRMDEYYGATLNLGVETFHPCCSEIYGKRQVIPLFKKVSQQ